MAILDQYIIQNANGDLEWTQRGLAVVDLLEQRDTVWQTNKDFVLGWFRGMDVQPNANTVLEFADELQEYINSGNKLSVWASELYSRGLIKWNYYAQAERPINPFAYSIGLTVTNIVDDTLIEDRIIKLDAGAVGFQEYADRIINFTYLDIFTQSQCTNLFGSFDPTSQLAREHVLAWFKGVNLQPTQAVINAYKGYIQAYLLDPRKEIDARIDIGIFLLK